MERPCGFREMAARGHDLVATGLSVAVASIAVAWCIIFTAVAADLKSEEEIAAMISSTYAVEVLRVRSLQADGRAAYAVTVMNPAANSNAAFQVNTLLVDAATGALIPTFRHHASGYDLSGVETYETDIKDDGMAMRRRNLQD